MNSECMGPVVVSMHDNVQSLHIVLIELVSYVNFEIVLISSFHTKLVLLAEIYTSLQDARSRLTWWSWIDIGRICMVA